LKYLSYIIPVLIWGSGWAAIRICIEPGGYPPLEAAAFRFTVLSLISALLWFAWSRFTKEKVSLTPALFWNLFWSGTFNGIAYLFLYQAETEISGGLASVISSTETFFVGLMVLFARHEKIAPTFWVGTLVAIVGIGIVFHDRMQVSSSQTVAMVQAILVAIAFAAGTVVLKEPSKTVHPIPILTFFGLFCALPLWALAFARGLQPVPAHPPIEATIAMLYLIFMAGIVAFLLFFTALKAFGVHKTSTMVLLIPMLALVNDHFLEKRMFLDFGGYVGIAVVLAGVAVCLVPTKDEAHTVQPADEIIIHG
jgi:drug/metabolite transporter (DMT)-like permease